MERSSNREWNGTTYRQHTGGVLRMARRRQERQTSLLVAAGLVISFLACLTISINVARVVTGWQSRAASRDRASAPPVQHSPVSAAPLAKLEQPKRPINILLLGSDQRGEDRSYRTDTIVLLSIDTTHFTASAVSFPRDMWVEAPTLYGMKINMIQAIGGFEEMADTFETNFGVRPDYYVLTNFSGFTHLIDSLGGIDVQIGQSLTDSCDLPQASDGKCTVEPGTTHMDGPTALWYVRSRESSSDYDRLRRAQEVVEAVFSRMMSLDALKNLPKYYQEYSEDVETNLTLGDITPLVPVAVRLFQEPDRVRRFVIDEDQATPSISWNGMWILLPDPDAISAVLEEAGVH